MSDPSIDELAAVVTLEAGVAHVSTSAPSDDAARIVSNLVTLRDLGDLALLAGGVAVDGAVRATDAGGFSIDGDVARVWDAGENEAVVSAASLRALLRRVVAEVLARRSELADVADAATWDDLERLAAS